MSTAYKYQAKLDKKRYAVNFNTPFKFNGKEQDEETGYSYYGARYYLGSDPNMPPIFGSVDPLADKYPGISSYVYCANNPLKYTDPTGMKIEVPNENSQKYVRIYLKEQFGDRSSKLFSFGSNGTMKLNNRQYNKFMSDKNVSSEQKELLSGMKEAINRPETATVRVFEDRILLEANRVSPDGFIDISTAPPNTPGVTMSPEGNFTNYNIGISDRASKNSPFYWINPDGSKIETGKAPSTTFIHEVLDEFLNFYTTGRMNVNSAPEQKTHYQNKALINIGKSPRNDHFH